MSDFIDINRPIPFAGTEEERQANRLTHRWTHYDEARCDACDSKMWHTAADYPCGQEPPREWVRVAR